MQRYDYKLHYVPFIVKEVFDKVKVGLLSTTIHITLEKVGKSMYVEYAVVSNMKFN